jgi:scyllo-inositol 2-dehydrogenase (NADP+)
LDSRDFALKPGRPREPEIKDKVFAENRNSFLPGTVMLKVGIIGLGKMGLSHQSIANAHPEIQLAAVCDTSTYVLDVLSKYTGVTTYPDYKKMFAEAALDAVFVATPSRYHAEVVTAALDRGLHVFCEKPFALDPETGFRLAELAESKRLVNQVGYHYRFIAAFNEAKRMLDQRVIGDLHHVRVEAYGPVVLRPKGSTWRSQKIEGGGCLFDYACHGIDLLNYLVGRPISVSGTVLNNVFSNDVEDEIYSTFQFSNGFYGQLATNWSDESFRKMSLKISLWGTNGRINVDRQEVQAYIRKPPESFVGLTPGWNVRYTTELTQPVWFYVRGEEYSAQIDHFVQCIKSGATPISSFRSASDASMVAAMMRADAEKPRTEIRSIGAGSSHSVNKPGMPPQGRKSFMRSFVDRLSGTGKK